LSIFPYRPGGGAKTQLWTTTTLVEASKGQRLFSCPKLLSNELLSSWVGRIAAHHDVKPSNIMQLWGFKGASSSLDFVILERDAVDRIARVTMHEPDLIAQASDLKWTIVGQPDFLCLIHDMQLVRPIYRCCVACLAEDRIPHFRYSWRLAYSFVCERHRCALIDSCFACGQLLDLTMRYSGKPCFSDRHSYIGGCGKCGTLYSTDACTPLDFDIAQQMITFQNWFHTLVTEGCRTECGHWASSRSTMLLYLRYIAGKKGPAAGFVGLDVIKLFGSQWRELAERIPCLASAARMVGI
jgi:hypothetical protein